MYKLFKNKKKHASMINKGFEATQLLIRYYENQSYSNKTYTSFTKLKLNWLMVFAEACNLVELGKRRYTNVETIEYWTYGPTIPYVDYNYHKFGQLDLSLPEYDYRLKRIYYNFNLINDEEAYILKRMFAKFKRHSPFDLCFWYLDIKNELNLIKSIAENQFELNYSIEEIANLQSLNLMIDEDKLSDNTLIFLYNYLSLGQVDNLEINKDQNLYQYL